MNPIFDLITVSEHISIVVPGLSQAGLNIVTGNTYRLTFNSTITSGILKVYQGSQLIFVSNRNVIDETSLIYVTEYVNINTINNVIVNDTVTITSNVALTIV